MSCRPRQSRLIVQPTSTYHFNPTNLLSLSISIPYWLLPPLKRIDWSATQPWYYDKKALWRICGVCWSNRREDNLIKRTRCIHHWRAGRMSFIALIPEHPFSSAWPTPGNPTALLNALACLPTISGSCGYLPCWILKNLGDLLDYHAILGLGQKLVRHLWLVLYTVILRLNFVSILRQWRLAELTISQNIIE